MIRRAEIYWEEVHCGYLEESEEGYRFYYLESYLDNPDARPVSKNLPLSREFFILKTMFPFFDGLVPEGWLLNIAEEHWKIDRRDRMGLLLTCCKDTIGAVGVEPEKGRVP